MTVELTPIGHVKTTATELPRHWSVSDVEGELVVDPVYTPGLKDIRAGQKIVVLFHFHRSPPFGPDLLIQKPPHADERRGVFSTCSPRRPNPIGLSILSVTAVRGNVIRVSGIDMLDGTPILDIKPHVPADGG